MRKAWLASLGVAVLVGAAVFVGAAAATTGAPVFYDARYPAPASTGADEYGVAEGADPGATTPGAIDEAEADGRPIPSPGTTPSDQPTPHASPTPTPTPTATPTPTPGADDPALDVPSDAPDVAVPPTRAERKSWLAFQQLLRDCMSEAGHEYRYWEWWNLGPDASNRFPAMPPDLTRDEAAAWQAALERCSDQAGSASSSTAPLSSAASASHRPTTDAASVSSSPASERTR